MINLIYYYLLINTFVFILMYIDKKRAIKNLWRIKEKNLFIFYFLGGFLGGIFSMLIFKHKTRKLKFYTVFTISAVIHCILYLIISNFI